MDEFGEKHSHHGGNLQQHMEDVGIQSSQTNIDHGENEGKPMSSKYEAKQQPNWQQVRTGTAPADDDLSGVESISNEDRFVTDGERKTIPKQLSGDAGSEIRHHQNEPSTSVKGVYRGNEGEKSSSNKEFMPTFTCEGPSSDKMYVSKFEGEEDSFSDEAMQGLELKFPGGKFIQYKTNHFCDDVVMANVEEECQYQLMVYRPIYRRMNDSYEFRIYCIPSNQDIANEAHRDAQSCEFQLSFAPLRFTLPATGRIAVQVEQEDPLLDCNVVEGRKVFECANLGNYHTTYIRCDLSDDIKRRGIVLKFTAMVNQRSEVKLIQAIWNEPPPGGI